MDVYLYLSEDGSIRGYLNSQPEGMNFPKINISNDEFEEFKNNFWNYKYEDGKLVKFVSNDEKIDDLKRIIQTQQTMLSNAIKSQAETQLQFNAALKMNSSFMQQLADLQVQIKKLQEAK